LTATGYCQRCALARLRRLIPAAEAVIEVVACRVEVADE